jgi:3-oxoacyl-[acyl-carrier-protein] synthase III
MPTTDCIGISGSGCYFPKRKVSVKDYARELNMDYSEAIAGHGVEQIGISGPAEDALYMATEAAKSAIKDAKLRAQDIDIIIFCDGILPQRSTRTCSSEIIMRLKADKAYGFDMEGGFIVTLMGIQIAKDAVLNSPHMRNVLIVASQTFNESCLYRDDRSRLMTNVFGDGAAAIVVTKNYSRNIIMASEFIVDHFTGYLNEVVERDGKHTKLQLKLKAPFAKVPIVNKLYADQMFSKLIDKCVRNSYQAVDVCLKSVNLDIKDINHFIHTQLLTKETHLLSKKLNISPEHIYNASAMKGHLGHADTLSNLHVALKGANLKNMHIIVLVSSNYDCSAGSIVLRR